MSGNQFLIALEGLDGSGKSTLFEALGPLVKQKLGKPTRMIDKKYPPSHSKYTDNHIQKIREILWEYPKEAPMQELGDMHWLYLLAAWFHVLDNTQIKPALRSGDNVIMESWCYKYLVRYRLKADYMFEAMMAAFYSLSRPNPIIYLDIDPEVAADRKRTFGISESGGMDGLKGGNISDFIAYQRTLRDIYLDFARQHDWLVIDVTNRPVGSITEEILDSLGNYS